MIRKTYLLLFFISLSVPFFSQQTSKRLQEDYQLPIFPTEERIVLDGTMEEAVWQSAPKAADFWMSYPSDDSRAMPEMQTEVMMTYDDNFIYLAVICHGAGPYVIPSLKRDNLNFWQGDAFSVVFDPVNEHTNDFSFRVNPAGVQLESLITGQTGTRGSQSSARGISDANDNKWFVSTASRQIAGLRKWPSLSNRFASATRRSGECILSGPTPVATAITPGRRCRCSFVE